MLATVEAIFEAADGREVVVAPRGHRARPQPGLRRRPTHDVQRALRPIVSEFVELHGQHEHQLLLDPAHPSAAARSAGPGSTPRQRPCTTAWDVLVDAERTLERAAMDAGERAARLELVEFHLGELRQARLAAGEDEELAQTRDVLRHADRLHDAVRRGLRPALRRRGGGALDSRARSGSGWGSWRRSTPPSPRTPRRATASRRNSKIWRSRLRDYQQRLDASPARLQQVEDRLALIERLKRKHGPTLDRRAGQDGRARTGAGRARRRAGTSGGRRGGGGRGSERASCWRPAACRLRGTAARRTFAAAIERELAELAMAGTRFELRLTTEEARRGVARPAASTAASSSWPPTSARRREPLARIASGGELSRSDAGVQDARRRRPAAAAPSSSTRSTPASAAAPRRWWGRSSAGSAQATQVLCITHLPPIAAQAATHFAIAKTVRGPRTVTTVDPP